MVVARRVWKYKRFFLLGGVNLIYCFASPARVLKMPPRRPILSAKSPRQSILLPIFTNFCQTGKKTNILNIYLAVTTLSSPITLLVISIYVYSVEVGVWNRYRPSRIRSACLAVHRSRWNGQNVRKFTRMTYLMSCCRDLWRGVEEFRGSMRIEAETNDGM